jgi:integrase
MKERRESYQQGTVTRVKRKRGPDVWVFRYRRYLQDGTPERVAVQFADVIECPSKAKALAKAEDLRREINDQRTCIFFRDLAKKYDKEVIPNVRAQVAATYRGNIRYMTERWGGERLEDIARTPMHIETWLNGLKSRKNEGEDLSRQTRQNIRMLMHHVMQSAVKWGYLRSNPVTTIHVSQGVKPKARKFLVSPELFKALLADPKLEHHVKVMIQVAMFTGLRASEFIALRWEDIDFHTLEIEIRRSAVGKNIQATKTDSSQAVVYISDYLADVLAEWKKHPDYPCIEGWVFGSIRTGRPFHEMTLQGKHLKPAGRRAGVEGLGWHAFRHTFRANLRDLAGADLEIQKGMMRHSSIVMTGRYGAESEDKKKRMRLAHEVLVQKITGTEG